MALGEAGSLYVGAALPDLLSMDCSQGLSAKNPRGYFLLHHAKYCFLRGQMDGSYRARSRAHPSLYVCAVTVTVGKCGA